MKIRSFVSGTISRILHTRLKPLMSNHSPHATVSTAEEKAKTRYRAKDM